MLKSGDYFVGLCYFLNVIILVNSFMNHFNPSLAYTHTHTHTHSFKIPFVGVKTVGLFHVFVCLAVSKSVCVCMCLCVCVRVCVEYKKIKKVYLVGGLDFL